jgi:hypothetical protein
VFVTTLEDATTVVGYSALAAAHVAPADATAPALKGQPRGRAVPAIVLAKHDAAPRLVPEVRASRASRTACDVLYP